MVCKHCMGANSEGRYFFSSLESLATCYTVLEKHYLKCPHVPEDIKELLRKTRSTHLNQRKKFQTGHQHAFFTRLWNRLRGSKVQWQNTFVNKDSRKTKGEKAESTDISNYIEVLDRIRNEKAPKDLKDALDRYYSCLEYGGRVYMTPAMPKNFSTQWLLAKITPKNYSTSDAMQYAV